jgi:hypothetical protein
MVSTVGTPTTGTCQRTAFRLRDLDDRQPPTHQLTRAANDGVSSFHRFDRYACPISHHNRLAQIKPRDLMRNLQSILNVAAFTIIGRTPGQRAYSGSWSLRN